MGPIYKEFCDKT